MIVFLIVLASIVAYLGVGVLSAVKAAPMIARPYITDRKPVYLTFLDKPRYYSEYHCEDILDRKIQHRQVALTFGWPVALPMLLFGSLYSDAAEKVNPDLMERKVRAQEKKIKALEKELGI